VNPALAWALLFIAGLFEVAWAIGLKYTEGFTKPVPTVLTVTAMVISMGLLGLVSRQLPIGTAYAVWTGIGVFGTAVLGMYLFGESMAPLRLLCLGLILTGIVGLKLTTA
jgi:quaternary ammonium compound-resistance protein SugE